MSFLKTLYKKALSFMRLSFKKKHSNQTFNVPFSHPFWRFFQKSTASLLNLIKNNKKLLLSLLAAFLIADLLLIKSYNFLLPDKELSPLSSDYSGSYTNLSPELYKSIWENNIFHTGSIPEQLEGASISSDPVLSSLPFKLKGTIIHANPRRSVATIKVGSGDKTLSYQPGDIIEKQAEIREIQRAKVVFFNQNNNRLEYIIIPKDQKPLSISYVKEKLKVMERGFVKRTGTGQFQVRRSDINEYLRKLPDILKQARVVPHSSKNGQMTWKFASIDKGSVWEELGFEKGDVIKEVDGESVQTPDKALELYDRLKKRNGVKILVEKNGRDIYYEYNVDENVAPL